MTTELESVLAEAAQRLQVPGVAVGIWQEGKEEHAFWGVTSVENPLPIDEGTLFQIGSTTKTYTATALAVLAERGQLDFEAAVRAYLPELRLRDEATAAKVTVRQLLNHTAGWEGDLFLDTGFGDEALARYVEAMAELGQTLPAGRAASYNNAAVSLAGRVVERVTGETYEEALRELVLEPLGLEETHVHPLEVMTRRFAVGHAPGENGPRVMRQWNLARSATPAGGITSTVPDQLRYARFHLGHGGEGVLSTDARRALQRPTVDFHRSDLGDAVGTSWLLKEWGGAQLVGHGGSTNGQRSAFQMVPARDFAVTVLTNASAGARLHREVVAWVLRDRLDLA
ncbi:MAG: serine hydrolase domain-containing protein, partial [Candidatus Dormibacteraceae bacterium]